MGYRRLVPLLALPLLACASPNGKRLSEFEAVLAAQDSATAALRHWCAERHMAEPADIGAMLLPGSAQAPPGLRARLEIGPDEPLGYRHVRLVCGETVMSEAHNWFVPGRLPAAMNHALNTSDTPFGKVIAPLGFTREPLASLRGAAPGCPASTIVSHRAVLNLSDGQPVSMVVECYTPANITTEILPSQ